MRRFLALLGLALLGFAVVPTLAHAQVIYVQPARVYAPPVVVSQPVVTSYYYAPSAPPPVVYSSSYYSAPPVVTYSAPPVVSYYSPSVVTYSAPPIMTYSAPAPGYYETRSYYGFGIFRPRGWTTETYYRP
jgi:hypothetical protein